MNALILPIALVAGLNGPLASVQLNVPDVGEAPSWSFADESDVLTQLCTRVTWELAKD